MSSAAAHATMDLWQEIVLSEERLELVNTVRRHLGSRFPRDVMRRGFDTGDPPAGAWDEMVASGYPLIGVPEACGGAGSMVDAVALLEAAGQELVPVPLLATVMSVQTLLSVGLPVTDGAARPGALGLGMGEHSEKTVRVQRLTVLDGASAQYLVVVLPRADGVVVAEVDLEAIEPLSTHSHIDPGRPVAVFHLNDATAVKLAEADLDVDTVLARARVALAADLTGIATGALDRALRHALDRAQFARKIGAFQAVKHRLADQYVAIERARSLTRAAAIATTEGNGDTALMRELSLLAKAASTDAAVDSTRWYVQVLGAMGMTFDADAHLYFRRAQQTGPVLGTASDCYRRAAQCRRSGRR